MLLGCDAFAKCVVTNIVWEILNGPALLFSNAMVNGFRGNAAVFIVVPMIAISVQWGVVGILAGLWLAKRGE
jgi:hypothetical protein